MTKIKSKKKENKQYIIIIIKHKKLNFYIQLEKE